MKIEIISVVAYGKNLVIGNKGTLPEWKLSADMQHFKELTIGCAVIMGRKTFESFLRPLPQRDNYIITKDKSYVPQSSNDRTFVCDNLLSAVNRAADRGTYRIFIIGGGEIYKAALELELVRKMIITVVDGEFEGDTYFPRIDPRGWKSEVLRTVQKDEKNTHSFSIVECTKH